AMHPPRLRRKAPAPRPPLTLPAGGRPEDAVEQHGRQAGVPGVRLPVLSGRVPSGPARLRALVAGPEAGGRLVAVERDWLLHPESEGRLRSQIQTALERFHRVNPLKPGMSREELRSRAGGADERIFAQLLGRLG